MGILSIVYEGYAVEDNRYATCLLLVREELCSTHFCYERSLEFGYPICSELVVEYVDEEQCAEANKDLLDSYHTAEETGCAFICLVDPLQSKRGFFNSPRFQESDFEKIICGMGGVKIPESTVKTPDFLLGNTVLELKDIQEEGLFNTNRRKAIAGIFQDLNAYTVNLDPTIDHGELTKLYHVQIRNTIQNHIKKASRQVKAYCQNNSVKAAGVILLNTGMFSLPHTLFRTMVTHILTHQTKTIEFAFIFSQAMQSNGFDTLANFYSDFVGEVPDHILPLKDKVSEMIETKMTESILTPESSSEISSQHPISFFAGKTIYYWNPGVLPDSRKS